MSNDTYLLWAENHLEQCKECQKNESNPKWRPEVDCPKAVAELDEAEAYYNDDNRGDYDEQ